MLIKQNIVYDGILDGRFENVVSRYTLSIVYLRGKTHRSSLRWCSAFAQPFLAIKPAQHFKNLRFSIVLSLLTLLRLQRFTYQDECKNPASDCYKSLFFVFCFDLDLLRLTATQHFPFFLLA